MKIIVVTGGVLSGLGKGVAAASIGHLLAQSYKVIAIKCDGYLNVDPGTVNPYEHGEVFVLEDGAEVDMDFGHYERFLGINCSAEQSLTMGKIYSGVIEKERQGDYLGEDVQLFPHVTEHIKERIQEIGKDADIVMLEIGGTVGDIENELYIRAAQQFRRQLGRENVMFVHLTFVPKPSWLGEHKTKPTQQSVQLLLQRGIVPDIIVTRSADPMEPAIKEKIKLFCGSKGVISGHDVENIYTIPNNFYEQGILKDINNQLQLDAHYDAYWNNLLENYNPQKTIKVGIAGKYTAVEDSYASVAEALKHCGVHLNTKIEIQWIETTNLKSIGEQLANIDAVIVPGGFGTRGIEGKMKIIQYCRENNIPFLGICYGMQLAVVEFARNVCGLTEAHTTESNTETPHPVVDILPEQIQIHRKGATMRLGGFEVTLKPGVVQTTYGTPFVSERHRHRYEVNPEYHEALTDQGLVFSGINGQLAEFIELPDHKYFVGTQGHPELKSKLESPAPLFFGLVLAATDKPQRPAPGAIHRRLASQH